MSTRSCPRGARLVCEENEDVWPPPALRKPVGPQPGAQPTWLLLHGTPLTPQVWDEVGALLATTRPVVAPALPPGIQTDSARRLLASLEDTHSPLHVVGHSFGGQVAIEVCWSPHSGSPR